jgi:hypothetical protein
MRLDSSGRLGIGTASPSALLHIEQTSPSDGRLARIVSAGVGAGFLGVKSTGNTFIDANTSATALEFRTQDTERARITSDGKLLVGTSSSASDSLLQIQGVAGSSTGQGAISLRRGYTPISDLGTGSTIGKIDFEVSNGGVGARIAAEGDAAMNTNDYPSRLVFSTCADGASSPTERMRIGNDGKVYVGKTAENFAVAGVTFRPAGQLAATCSNDFPIEINRINSDGGLVRFYQDGTEEGNISVSGTTVSYNGAHLSRWSQLPGGTERSEILRGTVLSNIDEMCGWGDEDNEQLNRMKVSDMEGDPNVAGVFQAWDDDDDTYTDDFYCAMTGDFIIRIAEGVTVQRGDLLMSAGDGTAKPQDDDIIRSKTIAKVTSTHVTCTYDDGSYCVPCVLMAC